MKEFYERNADFRRYVDKYCSNKPFEKEEAFRHAIVQEVAKGYK